VRCSRSKILEKRDESKLLRLAHHVGMKRLVAQGIELAGFHISFELTVPNRSIKSCIPFSKRCQFFRRERLNLLFYGFDLAHDITTLPSIPVSSMTVSQVQTCKHLPIPTFSCGRGLLRREGR